MKQAAVQDFRRGLQANDNARLAHQRAVALVDCNATTGGHNLSIKVAELRQRLALEIAEAGLSLIPKQDFDGHALGTNNLCVHVDKGPAQALGDCAPGRRLARAGEAGEEDVGA